VRGRPPRLDSEHFRSAPRTCRLLCGRLSVRQTERGAVDGADTAQGEKVPMSDMRRREFITLLGGAALAWPAAATAQAPGRLWKIGVLANEPWPPLEGLRDGLRDLGYVEGKTHLFVYRFAQGNAERFPALASELVNLPVDVIVSWGTPASLAAHNATDTIPIVMSAGDPNASRNSLSRCKSSARVRMVTPLALPHDLWKPETKPRRTGFCP
jgi:ABC transporter substrate binding protein